MTTWREKVVLLGAPSQSRMRIGKHLDAWSCLPCQFTDERINWNPTCRYSWYPKCFLHSFVHAKRQKLQRHSRSPHQGFRARHLRRRRHRSLGPSLSLLVSPIWHSQIEYEESMAAVWRRVCQLSTIPGFGVSKSKVSSSSSSFHRAIFDPFPVSGERHFSQSVKSNGKHLFLVDTLALVRRLEGEGVPSKQAEVITAAFTEVLNDSLENVSKSLVSMGEMQKIEMMQECNLSKFKAEVQSSQGHHFSLLQHETEKLRNDIEKMRSELRNDKEKMRSELRYEIDKVTAGQRLDLNLERGRIREELSNQNAETTSLTNKLDREIHSLRAQLEAAKYDVIKYCIGTLVSISAVGLAVLRILM